jgi:ferrochelatase
MRALLLLAFGGPRSLDEVEFLLTRLFKKKPSPDVLERVIERYRLIGGRSPLPEITYSQARALENKLKENGYRFKSYVGMRYGHPLIEETLDRILREGILEIVALPMTPLRSPESTGAYVEELNRVIERTKGLFRLLCIEGWHLHPLFLEAVREKIREGLLEFAAEDRKKVHLIFTAHSLPKSMIENDLYVEDMRASVKGVLKGMESFSWRIAYQSKGAGPGEWIGPDVESVLAELAGQNVKEALIVPIGFVSDHIEILYDIDMLYQKKAASLGMVLKRTQSLNVSEKFIEALADTVEEHLKRAWGVQSL